MWGPVPTLSRTECYLPYCRGVYRCRIRTMDMYTRECDVLPEMSSLTPFLEPTFLIGRSRSSRVMLVSRKIFSPSSQCQPLPLYYCLHLFICSLTTPRCSVLPSIGGLWSFTFLYLRGNLVHLSSWRRREQPSGYPVDNIYWRSLDVSGVLRGVIGEVRHIKDVRIVSLNTSYSRGLD